MRRLKKTEVPKVREHLMREQGYLCPLCERSFKGRCAVKPALDHNHITGKVRAVLCLNCNGMEGKLHNIARRAMAANPDKWISAVLDYWKKPQLPLLHPTHKTDAEKRVAINKKARARRAAKKGNP